MGSGQGDDHAAPERFVRLGMDLAAVEVDDPSCDRESETGAAIGGGARGIGPVEAFEDPFRIGRGDAGPFVDDFDRDVVLGPTGSHLHRPSLRRVAHGVLEQVGDDLMDPFGVTVGGEVASATLMSIAIPESVSSCSRTAWANTGSMAKA